MNKPIWHKAIFSFLILVASVLQLQAQELPKKKDVLNGMRLTNKYFMNLWPDAGKPIFTDKERPSHIWTRGVYYEGLMELYRTETKKKNKKVYYDYAVQWGEKHNWGLRSGTARARQNADDQTCGQTYIDLYLIDKKEERIKDIKEAVDGMLASDKVDDWWWIDALQMAMPVFVRFGNLYNDSRYYDKMYQIYNYTKTKHGGNGLWNPADKLWWRDKDFVPPYKEPNGEDCYWSRGNGWVVAALVRVLQKLPKSDPHYNEYLQDYKDMLQALVPIQRADGFWNVSLHDATHFGGKETSGTALFVYGMAYGVNNGLISKETYLPVLLKGWNAIAKESIHPNGKLGYVQGTGKEPKDGQPVSYTHVPDFEDYGLGCVLMAGSEVYKLAK